MGKNDATTYDWNLTALHEKHKEALLDLHNFCEKNDIQYCLAYGSVLGAIRHNGFIPWDDDVDVYMSLDNYLKFKQAFSESSLFKEKYYLQEFDRIGDMVELPKLRINNTAFIEKGFENLDIHQGIYIDIFILHNARDTFFSRAKQYISSQYLVLKSLSNRKYGKKYKMLMFVLRLFPYNFLREKCLKNVYKYKDINTNIFFDSDLRRMKSSFVKKIDIFPPIKHEFEDIELYIPCNYVGHLERFYGDYNAIPSIDSIKSHLHNDRYSVDEDFREYASNIVSFKDEERGLRS